MIIAGHAGTELWDAATPRLRFPRPPDEMDAFVAAVVRQNPAMGATNGGGDGGIGPEARRHGGGDGGQGPLAPRQILPGGRVPVQGRGSHSSFSRLNLSTFYGIGGASRGCLGGGRGD
jgi:hypothetical protein